MRGDEVLHHRQPFSEVRLDRALDDLADTACELLLRFGHQPPHPGELTHLVPVTAGAGGHHHVHRVEATLGALEAADHGVSHVVVRVGPGIDHLVVALAVRDEAAGVRLLEPSYLLVGLFDNLRFLVGHFQVVDSNADAAHGGVAEPEVFEVVQESRSLGETDLVEAVEDQVTQLLLRERAVHKAELVGDDGIEEHSARSRAHPVSVFLAVLLSDPVVHWALERQPFLDERHLDLAIRGHVRRALIDLVQLGVRGFASCLGPFRVVHHFLQIRDLETRIGQVVRADDHVLRRCRNGTAVGRQ